MCDHAAYQQLKDQIAGHEERLGTLENTVAEMRRETRDGLSAVNASIVALSRQMANMDSRIVEEKIKWGDVFRSVVKWTIRTGLAIIAYAAGLNITKVLLNFTH